MGAEEFDAVNSAKSLRVTHELGVEENTMDEPSRTPMAGSQTAGTRNSGSSPTTGPGGMSEAKSARSVILSSGHEVRFSEEEAGERIEVRSGSGDVELTITLTKAGPVVRISGSQLQMESSGKLSIRCEELDVRTTKKMKVETGEAIELRTSGEIRMRSAEQTFIDGDYVNLNCLDRTGYHDAGQPQKPDSDSEGD